MKFREGADAETQLIASPAPAAGVRGTAARGAVAVVLLGALAIGIALFRFRLSPIYSQLAYVNSDIYVYQVVGNSWVDGRVPYQGVYDVKGPFFYLLFGVFAWLRAWSTGPTLVTLAAGAGAAVWLAFRIARRFLGFVAATLCAAAAGLLIYRTVLDVPTSFSCEELSVPGVLLLLWLLLRTFGGESVPSRWWLLCGAVFGALFWSKYQVIAPWGAVLVALLLAGNRHRLPAREVWRIVRLHLAGLATVTVVVLFAYRGELGTMLYAYFIAKISDPNRPDELTAEAQFAGLMWRTNLICVLVLLACFVVLTTAAARMPDIGGTRSAATVFAIAMVPATWASVFGVRHPQNIMVPLCFLAVGIPMLVSMLPRPEPERIAAAGVITALAAMSAIPSWHQSESRYGLLGNLNPVRCHALPANRTVIADGATPLFLDAAGGRPILSVNSMYAARTRYATHTVPRHRFEFADPSWAPTSGAAEVQARYLRDRTYEYVWAGTGRRFDPREWRDVGIFARSIGRGMPTAEQLAAIKRHYTPVLVCGTQVLLRADGPR